MNPYLAGVLILCAYFIGGTMDYNDKKAAADARKAASEPARIWSKRCAKDGKLPLVLQADGKAPRIRCVSGKELRV